MQTMYQIHPLLGLIGQFMMNGLKNNQEEFLSLRISTSFNLMITDVFIEIYKRFYLDSNEFSFMDKYLLSLTGSCQSPLSTKSS